LILHFYVVSFLNQLLLSLPFFCTIVMRSKVHDKWLIVALEQAFLSRKFLVLINFLVLYFLVRMMQYFLIKNNQFSFAFLCWLAWHQVMKQEFILRKPKTSLMFP